MNTFALQSSPRPIRPTHQTVAGVAHDLKLPLSHIKGFVTSLRRDDVEWDAETRDEFLSDIEHEVDRLTQMIEGLMSSNAAGSRGRKDNDFALTDPATIVSDALEHTDGLYAGRPVTIDIAPNLPWVSVDAPQIERLLANLLQNAVKYSPAATPIGVCARMHGPDELELTVENEGRAIPLDDQRRLFEPFFRNKAATRSGVPGHGLGLAICQSIALTHGGRMGVVSRAGRTRFSVFLPLPTALGRVDSYLLERKTA